MKKEQQIILAIDPGSDKAGIAVIDLSLKILEKDIINFKNKNEIIDKILILKNKYNIKLCALGNGTKSDYYKNILIESGIENISLVDEKNSTFQAREKYFIDHPPRGIKKFLPKSLLYPTIPIDDYAAVIIGERYIHSYSKEEADEA